MGCLCSKGSHLAFLSLSFLIDKKQDDKHHFTRLLIGFNRHLGKLS